ncbi:lytic transglycosylase domain-containing protein [Tepidamorphus sp. 3E244]|uniref:lytic transglycosylase domain-containing protein n=1 Tax=Tepidamorphus sp. 3E244 TaxID=3385498 RepID=UPI0038FC5C76
MLDLRSATFIAKPIALGLALACVNAPGGKTSAQTTVGSIADLIQQAAPGTQGVSAETVSLPQSVPMPRNRPQRAAASISAPMQTQPAQRAAWSPRVLQAGEVSSAERKKVDEAIGLIRKGQFSSARAIGKGLRHPVAKGVIEYMILRQANSGSSVDDFAAFLFTYADWPTESIRSRMEDVMIDEQPKPATVKHILSAFPPESGKGRLALALAQQATGEKQAARQTILHSWRTGDIYGNDGEARALKVLGQYLDTNDDRIRLRALFYNDDNISGMRAAERLGGADKKLGLAWRAVNKRSGDARKLLNAVPSSLHSDPGYQFAEIQWHRRAGQEIKSAELMAKASRQFDALIDPDEWWIERRLAARNAIEAGKHQLAYQIAAGHAAQTNWLQVEAEFHAGWIALRFLNNPRAAVPHFERTVQLAQTPISTSRAHYWLGRALQAAGEPTATGHYQAAAAHPTTYYGQLAVNAMGGIGIRIPKRPQANNRLAQTGPLQAINLLNSIGEESYLVTFFYDLRERLTDPGDLTYLAERAGAIGQTHLQVRIGKKGTQDGFPLERHAFPVGVVPNVRGDKFPEQALIYAIARQESEFNAAARSPAGARGLMQVMPATAKGIAQRNGYKYSINALSSEPSYNAKFGATYLGERIGQFNGSYILAIASYNAGKGNVDKWIKRFGDPRDPRVDPVDWVELIPFTETRNYVQRVMENLQVYRALLPGTEARVAIAQDLMRGATN